MKMKMNFEMHVQEFPDEYNKKKHRIAYTKVLKSKAQSVSSEKHMQQQLNSGFFPFIGV